ncbi:hypothetical protein ACHAXR_007026 [Thalassiosira sp. AJA248-18]
MNSTAFLLLSALLGTTAFQHQSFRAATIVRESTSKLGLASENNEVDVATRRSFCARSLTTLASASVFTTLSPTASYAAESKLEPFEDPDFGFRLQVPSTWEKSEQNLSGRRKGVFFTDTNSKDATTGAIETLGFIAYTPIRDDFTSLASFGSVDEVAQATIMPKGELAGQDDNSSKMLSAVAKNNAYYFDYITTPVVPTEPGAGGAMTKTLKPVHFKTIFTLLPLKGAAGLTLVTITLQTTEERYGGTKAVFDGVVDSFGKMK